MHDRRFSLLLIFGVVFAIFILRLFFLQVLSPEFSADAQRNVVKKVVLQPSRGIMYDREGRIYVSNEPIYDLTITPEELEIQDTSVLVKYLGLERPEIRARIQEAVKYSPKQPSQFQTHIDSRLYTQLQEHLWNFKGLNTVVRSTRSYQRPVGGNFLGYITEVDSTDIKASQSYYEQGDLIGRSGLERRYEELLRGKKGVQMVLKDVHGRKVGRFAGGSYDTLPQKGQDIQISVDAELQAYGEKLMQGKKGAVVAIEPATGEILAFVSTPTYNPNRLTGMNFAKNFVALKRDTLLPLYNRALMSMYPPGSIFKTIMAATSLEEGTLDENTIYRCGGGFMRNGGRPACHSHGGVNNIFNAVKVSCNSFFAATYVDFLHHDQYKDIYEAFNTWRRYMRHFGLGRRLGIDIPNEKPGMLPSTKLYDDWYGHGRWKGMTVVSNGIGQGEIKMTPLQMANLAAILANRGHYITPHFFKGLYKADSTADVNFERVDLPIDTAHFNLVADAMREVVQHTTGRMADVPGLEVCGKTGTSQNPHGEDHSVFISFAPKDTPKIAVATVVENAGYGSTWAAPICGLMTEKYLNGEIMWRRQWQEDRILNKRFYEKPKPEGEEEDADETEEADDATPAEDEPTDESEESEGDAGEEAEDDARQVNAGGGAPGTNQPVAESRSAAE